MGLLDEFFGTVDRAKRTVRNSLLDVADDPLGALGRAVTRYAEENLPKRNAPPGDVLNKALDMGMNIGPSATVYHGSPHLFDRFDISKIGTGEGAQAYGHGLYFAERPGVAVDYKNRLAAQKMGDVTYAGKTAPALDNTTANTGMQRVIDLATIHQGDLGKVRQSLLNSGDTSGLDWFAKNASDLVYAPKKGALYKVDLPDKHIAKMLDWDKPLKDQPEALAAIRGTVPADMLQSFDYNVARGIEGANAYHNWTFGDRVATGLDGKPFSPEASKSAALLRLGIPGIKYFDQGSRAAGQGTHNYVVFDDSLLNILGRE